MCGHARAMRFLLVLGLFFFVFSCTAANLVGSEPVPKVRLDSRKKVALVGFHPYSTSTVGVKLDGWINSPCKSVISQKYGTDLKSAFFKGRRNVPSDHRAAYPLSSQVVSPLSWGEPISKFPSTTWEENIPEENIKDFIEFSYKHLAAGALPDICEVLDWDASSKSFRLKKRNVDYFVVGFFTPVFWRPTFVGAVSFAVSFPFSFLSLGILPTVWQKQTDSFFRVYDSKLNVVKNLETKNSFWTISALWVFPSDRSKVVEEFSYDPPAWEKDVEELDRAWRPE